VKRGEGTGGVRTTASSQPQHAPARPAAQGPKGHSKGVHAGPASAAAQACSLHGSQHASACPGQSPRRRGADSNFGEWRNVCSTCHGSGTNQLASAPRAAEVAAFHDPTFAAYIPLSVSAASLCSRQTFSNGPPSLGLDADRSQSMDQAQSHCRGHGPSKSQLFSFARGYARRLVSICVCIWWLCFSVSSAQPTVTSLSPQNSPAVGGGAYVQLVIEGTGFGNTKALISVAIGTFRSAQISFAAGTIIMARLPAGVGGGKDVFVYVEGIPGVMNAAFSYDAPKITALSPGTVPTSGGMLTVLGVNFGVEDYAQSSSSAGIDLETIWISDSTFKSAVFPGTGAGKGLTCSVASQDFTLIVAFSYAQPLLTSVSNPVAVTRGGGPFFQIQGANFGVSNSSPRARLALTSFMQTEWVSDSALSGKTAGGVGGDLDVFIEVAGQVGTKLRAMSYAAPSVTHTTPGEAPTAGGASLTLLGSNFGGYDTSVAGKVGGSSCLRARWTSDSAMACLVAPGTGAALTVTSLVASQPGRILNALRFSLPNITALTPATGPTSGGFSVTVFGTSFGTYDASPSLTVGQSRCTRVTYVSDTSLVCGMPAGMGTALSAGVEVDGQTQTGQRMFSYNAPLVTSAAPLKGPTAGGTNVQIVGQYFGLNSAAQSAHIGNSPCSQSVWTSDSSIKCVVPAGGGVALAVSVNVLGNTGSLLAGFCYDAPSIESAHPGLGPTTGGTILTIIGQSFGAAVGMSTVLVHVGGTACLSSSYGSNVYMLNCIVPPGSGLRLPVSVSIDGQVTTRETAFSYAPPLFYNIQPGKARAKGGDNITLIGASFGVASDSQVTKFAGTASSITYWTSDSSLAVTAPPGVGSGHSIFFTTRGQWRSLQVAFSFIPPQLTACAHPNIPARRAIFTLLGHSFGSSDYTAALKVSADDDQLRMGSACENSQWISDSSVACKAASGGGSLVTVSATVAQQRSSLRPGLTYDLPLITSSVPHNFAQTGGAFVTMLGLNFAPNDYSTGARMGKTACMSQTWTSDSSLQCKVPVGTTAREVALTVFKKMGTSFYVFSYNAPGITHVSSRNVPSMNKATITLLGSAYGAWDTGAVVGYIGASPCVSTLWTSDSAIRCTVGHGVGPAQDVVLGLETTKSILPGHFSYDSPYVLGITLGNAPPALANHVMMGIEGGNLGSSSYSPRGVVGYSACESSAWVSDSVMFCSPAAGAYSVRNLCVTMQRVVSGTRTGMFSYDGPRISQASGASNVPTLPSDALLQVTGIGFGQFRFSPTVRSGATHAPMSMWCSDTSVLANLAAGISVALPLQISILSIGTLSRAMSHDVPQVSAWKAGNVATTGGQIVTVANRGLGACAYSSSARLAASSCAGSAWLSDSSITCHVSGGIGSGTRHMVALSVALQVGTRSRALTYDVPLVFTNTSGQSYNLAALPAARMSVSGRSMGMFGACAQVSVGGSASESTRWVSDSSLVAHLAAGSFTGHSLCTTVAVQKGTCTLSYTFDDPAVTHMRSPNIPTSGLSNSTLLGLNFGSNDLSARVFISSSVCIKSLWTSDSSIVCSSVQGIGIRKTAKIVIDGVDHANCITCGTLTNAYSYDFPAVSSLSRTNGPQLNQWTVVFRTSGSGFGHQVSGAESVYVSIDGHNCVTSEWIADSSIICNIPDLVGPSKDVSVFVDGQTVTLSSSFTYDRSTIRSVVPANVGIAKRKQVTVLGKDLGVVDTTAGLRLGITASEASVWVAESSLVCAVAAGIRSGLPLAVSVYMLVSTATTLFSYDAPALSSPSAANRGYITSGTVLFVSNLGLGASSLAGRTGVSACEATAWFSDSSVTSKAQSSLRTSLRLAITVGASMGSFSESFSFDGHRLRHFQSNVALGVPAVLDIDIEGPVWPQEVTSRSRMLGTSSESTMWKSLYQLTARSASGQGSTLRVHVTSGSQTRSSSEAVSFDVSKLDPLDVSRNAYLTSPAVTTVRGQHLRQLSSTPALRFAVTACEQTVWLSHTAVLVRVPSGVGASKMVSATAGVQTGSTTAVLSFDTVSVTKNMICNTPSTGAIVVSVTGAYMGTAQYSMGSRVASSAAETTVWKSDSSLLAVAPAGTAKAGAVMLSLSARLGTLSQAISYNRPELAGHPDNGPTSGGVTVTITGTSLGLHSYSAVMRASKFRCREVQWASDTSVLCNMRDGSGLGLDVFYTVAQQQGSLTHAFSYDKPSALNITSRCLAAAGTTVVTVSGWNFGDAEALVDIRIGGTSCQTTTFLSFSEIRCLIAPGIAVDHTLTVQVQDQFGTLQFPVSYNAPAVHDVTVKSGPATGGTVVPILGKDFGAFDASTRSHVGATATTKSVWMSDSAVTGVVAQGVDNDRGVGITVASLLGTFSDVFSYFQPRISATPANTASVGGRLELIGGGSFATSDTSMKTRIGLSACESTQWASDSRVACKAAQARFQDPAVVVTVASQISTKLNAITHDFTTLSQMHQSNARPSNISTVVVTGTALGNFALTHQLCVSGSAADSSRWISDSSLAARVPSGSGTSQKTSITVGFNVGSVSLSVSYDHPSVLARACSVAANVSRSRNMALPHRVMRAGLAVGVHDVTLRSRILGTTTELTQWFSGSSMQCKAAQSRGILSSLSVIVTAGLLSASLSKSLSYDALTYVQMDNATIGGNVPRALPAASFHSLFLATNINGLQSSAARFGRTSCENTAWTSSRALVCRASGGYDASMRMSVTSGNLLGTSSEFVSYDRSQLQNIVASNMHGASPKPILLSLDLAPASLAARIAFSATEASGWISSSSLRCAAVSGLRASTHIVLTNGARARSISETLTFDMPFMSSLKAGVNHLMAFVSFTLIGSNFQTNDGTFRFASSTTAEASSWHSTTSLAARNSKGQAGSRTIIVTACGRGASVTSSLTHDVPIVSASRTSNAVTTQEGQVLTVSGTALGALGPSARARVGLSTCETTLWRAATSVVCMRAAGLAISQHVSITAGGAGGSVSETVSYDALCQSTPAGLDAVTRRVNTRAAGGLLRLKGCEGSAAFGLMQERSMASRIGRSGSEATMWWSTSSMAAKAARGGLGSVRVAMTVGNRVVSATESVSYDIGGLSGLGRGNLGMGRAATVLGGGMGSMVTTGALRVASTASEATVWQSDSSVVGMAGLDRRVLGSSMAAVTCGSAAGSLTEMMSFDRMVLSSARKANTAAHRSGEVRVMGGGYGGGELSARTRVGMTGGESSGWLSSTAMACKTSPSLPGTLRVAITVGRTLSSGTEAVSYDSGNLGERVLAGESTNAGLTAGSLVASVSGSMLAGGHTWAVRMGGSGARATDWMSATQMVCRMAAGAVGRSLRLVVTGGSAMGTGTELMSYEAAVAQAVRRGNAPATGSVSLSVFGSAFAGAAQLSPASRFSSSVSEQTLWMSDSALYLCLPSGVGKVPALVVSVLQLVSSVTTLASYDSPDIAFFPVNGPTSGGVTLSLLGNSIGVADYSPGVRTGNFKCRSSRWQSESSLLCKVGQGSASGLDIMLTVSRQSCSLSHAFSYDTPTLTSISPMSTPTSGGLRIYLEGTNFGYDEGRLNVVIGGRPCTNAQFVTYSLITCTSPHGVGDTLAVIVQVEDLSVKVLQMFSYFPPLVSSISGLPSPTSGGWQFELFGRFFGVQESTPRAGVGGTACDSSTWLSDSNVNCLVGCGVGRQHQMSISIASSETPLVPKVVYQNPIASSLQRSNAPATGAVAVRVSGTNHGTSSYSQQTQISLTACEATQWTSNTHLACLSPAGSGKLGVNALALTVMSSIGSLTSSFSTDLPLPASSVSVANRHQFRVTGLTTLSGANLGHADFSQANQMGHSAAASTKWASTSSLHCGFISGITMSRSLVVTANGAKSSRSEIISYDLALPASQLVQNVATGLSITLLKVDASDFLTRRSFSMSVKVGMSACAKSSWVSESALSCRSHQANGRSLALVVTAGMHGGTVTQAVSMDGAVLTRVAPNNLASIVSTICTLTGSHLGFYELTSAMAVGASAAESTAWHSKTTVRAKAVLSTGGSMSIVVTLGQQAFSIIEALSMDVAFRSALGGTRNFLMYHAQPLELGRAWARQVAASPSMRIAFTSCEHTAWASSSSVLCKTSRQLASTSLLRVSMGQVSASISQSLSFDAIFLSSARLTNAHSGKILVNLMQIFGNMGSTKDHSVEARTGSSSTASTLWMSASSLKCAWAAGVCLVSQCHAYFWFERQECNRNAEL
jgi:hypothetical protein